MAREMSKLGAKAMGKAKAVGKLLKGETGILSHLADEHGEVDGMMQRIGKSPDDVQLRRDLFPEIRKNLLAHAEAEEKAFYPQLRSQPNLGNLVERSLEQHQEIERMVRELGTMDHANPTWQTTFDRLVNAVEQHVELEEGEIFPKVKDLFSAEQRSAMLEQFEQEEQATKQRLGA